MKEAASCDLKELVGKFIPESIGKEMEKACFGIYPLQNTFIRKVKILKAPKFDLGKLMEVSEIGGGEGGTGEGAVYGRDVHWRFAEF